MELVPPLEYFLYYYINTYLSEKHFTIKSKNQYILIITIYFID